jgi:hypothetical protein
MIGAKDIPSVGARRVKRDLDAGESGERTEGESVPSSEQQRLAFVEHVRKFAAVEGESNDSGPKNG